MRKFWLLFGFVFVAAVAMPAFADGGGEDECIGTGGAYSDPQNPTQCICDEKKNLKLTADGKSCECIEVEGKEFRFVSAAKGCEEVVKVEEEDDEEDLSGRLELEINANISIRVKNARKQITVSKSRIEELLADLDLKKNVWRDVDGNFNSARLASDTVAGVVLGTAGALITSHVIEKSQVKNGLEDIQCTIGGQVVGSFGDSFRVGMR